MASSSSACPLEHLAQEPHFTNVAAGGGDAAVHDARRDEAASGLDAAVDGQEAAGAARGIAAAG